MTSHAQSDSSKDASVVVPPAAPETVKSRSFNIPLLDEWLDGGLEPGSTWLIEGPPGGGNPSWAPFSCFRNYGQ
jgi:hypothetical protein